MEMAAAAADPSPSAKRRRVEAPQTQDPENPAPVPAGGDGSGGGVDRISGLHDAILCEIVSLLATKEAARTQVLSSRWRHVWRATPLTLDAADLAGEDIPADADEALAGAVSRVLAAHPGPGRRFRAPPRHLHDRPATVDAWLCSPALDNLQDLDFSGDWDLQDFWEDWDLLWFHPAPPPASTFRFSATLQVARFNMCELLDSSVEGLKFSNLKQLALEYVSTSEAALQKMISCCPVLEYLLLDNNFGFSCIRISSSSLRSIGVDNQDALELHEFIIVDAPCLERLLFLGRSMSIIVSVIAAPKLETLGCLSDGFHPCRLVFGTTAIQGSQVVNLTTVVCNVKILAVKSSHMNLTMVIDLMKCFPCLEKLYVKCCIQVRMNHLRRTHRRFVKCFDISLKTIVLEEYQGTRSQVIFASYFLLNASKLESMTLEVENRADNEAFFMEQYGVLQMEKRASRTARLHLSTNKCRRYVHVNHVRDLAVTDPFECRC